MTRWLEPFIDYGPDYNRATPLYDATIAVGCRARELLSREGAKEPDISQQADNVSTFFLAGQSIASSDTSLSLRCYSCFANTGPRD